MVAKFCIQRPSEEHRFNLAESGVSFFTVFALFALQPTTSHFMALEIKNVHLSSPRLGPTSKPNNELRKPQASCTVQVTGQLGIILLLTGCRISPYLLGFVFLWAPSVINVSSLHARQLNETANRDAGEGRTSQSCFPLFDSILRAIAVLCGYRWSWV